MDSREDHIKRNVTNGDKPDTRRVSFDFTLETDLESIKESFLGRKNQECKICETKGDFETWIFKEHLIGTNEEFKYFICGNCETLQIEKFPEDIGKYYNNQYYEYKVPEMTPPDPNYPRDTRMILDVGCGAGVWLCDLVKFGCVNLYGCDPYIDEDRNYPNGVTIYKKNIHKINGCYDVIAFRDSLEHMPDSHEVFDSLKRLLKNKGDQTGSEEPKIEINLPVYPSLMFDMYGPYSFILDAPRHFFLYSVKAITYLAKKNGFQVVNIINGELWHYYSLSRGYQLGLNWKDFWKVYHEKNVDLFDANEELFKVLSESARLTKRSSSVFMTLMRR